MTTPYANLREEVEKAKAFASNLSTSLYEAGQETAASAVGLVEEVLTDALVKFPSGVSKLVAEVEDKDAQAVERAKQEKERCNSVRLVGQERLHCVSTNGHWGHHCAAGGFIWPQEEEPTP
jgi:hypothetical protein